MHNKFSAEETQKTIDQIVKKNLELIEQKKMENSRKAIKASGSMCQAVKRKKPSSVVIYNSNANAKKIRLWEGFEFEIRESEWQICASRISPNIKGAREAIRFLVKKFIPDDQLINMSADGGGDINKPYGNAPVDKNLRIAIRGKIIFLLYEHKIMQ